MIHILIADDHPIIVKGVQQILTDAFTQVSTDVAVTTQEVIKKIWENEYDLVLLDISMPGRGGLEALKQIKKDKPGIPVLIFSMHPEEQYAIRALRAGASGYLTKDSAPEELTVAIDKVLHGRKFISMSISERLISELKADPGESLHATLSDREYEVMVLIASGKTVSEIAKELSLSVKTISTYRGRIMDKLSMHTNAELTRYAIDNKIVA